MWILPNIQPHHVFLNRDNHGDPIFGGQGVKEEREGRGGDSVM